ncbi:MAG: molecular chaperone HtpG, partial [Kofleriaceae bacterium]|nr:molecular chaperone HtpG [Kofleriaceae bacterium]
SAACLVSDERDPNPRMMKILEQFGQKPEPVKRILEINPEHPAVRGLHAVFAASSTDPRLPLMARLLMGQAQLAEGTALTDPTAFRAALDELMTRAVG